MCKQTSSDVHQHEYHTEVDLYVYNVLAAVRAEGRERLTYGDMLTTSGSDGVSSSSSWSRARGHSHTRQSVHDVLCSRASSDVKYYKHICHGGKNDKEVINWRA